MPVTVDVKRIEQALNTRYRRWDVYYTRGASTSEFIAERLGETATGSGIWRQHGTVYCNGLPADWNTPVIPPMTVELYEPKTDDSCRPPSFNLETHRVFEESGLMVVYKPPRFHTLPAKEARVPSLAEALEESLGSDLHLPSRLDYSTAGLVLFSTFSGSHAYVQQLFQQRWIEKYYLCEVTGTPPWQEYLIDAPIDIDPRHPVLRRVVIRGGLPAQTRFTVLASSEGKSLLCARPYTGRTHQIRVHAATLGYPLQGDNFYNGHPSRGLHLLAFALRFPALSDNRPVRVAVPAPLRPAWLAPYDASVLESIGSV